MAVSSELALDGTAESVRRAVAIWPYRAEDYRSLAALEPDEPAKWFDQAVALNARDPRSWLRAGLQAESENDFATAEHRLLEAARVDRTFEPAWTLANYYFRRGEETQFWDWTRRAAAIAHGDLTPVYDLCWRERPDAGEILRSVAGAGCTHRRELFEYLRGAEAAPEAVRLAGDAISGCADQESRMDLARYANDLLFTGRGQEAAGVWHKLYPASGQVLTNGDFHVFPTRLGFDWHYDPIAGVTLTKPAGGGVSLSFDGSEPEAVGVLYQPLLLQAATEYELTMDVGGARGAEMPSGFRWRMGDLRSGSAILPDGPDMAGQAGMRPWRFRSSSGTACALILLYQRPSGSTLFQGEVELRRVEVKQR
jgi:hypothetical protein